MPKTDKISADAAGTLDIQPAFVYDNSKTKTHSILGGSTGNTPVDIAYASMGGSSNVTVNANNQNGSCFYSIYENKSTLNADIGFIVFSANVTVPAGGVITVQYKFDLAAGKAACSSDAGSHFAAELYHFGSSDPINDSNNSNPVDVSTLTFATGSTSAAYSAIRLDGTFPTTIFNCPIGPTSDNDNPAIHQNTASYGNLGTTLPGGAGNGGTATVEAGTFTTSEITYTNTASTSKTFKEYFGYACLISSATSSCHIGWSELSINTEKAEFTKISKPTTSVVSKNYSGSAQSFVISGLTAKTELVKVTKTALNGSETTVYSHNFYSDVTTPDTGINPLSGNTCQFTDAGKYKLSFRPNGAVWSDTKDSAAHEITFYILPKVITKPTVATADVNGKTYSGAEQTFTLSMSGGLTGANWSDYIDIDSAKGGDLPTGVTDNSNGGFGITDAGDYEVYLTLKDEVNTCWSGSSFNTTTWDASGAGGTAHVALKVRPFELTVDQLTCDKLDASNNWAWNMGDTATVTLKISGFKLPVHTTQGDADSVTLSYYYSINGADNPVSAKTETYDSATNSISAVIELPSTLAQGEYKFGVKPDDSVGAGKNYTVKTSLATKSFKISAKGFDPSVLEWTYTVDGVADATKRIADGDKLKYALKQDGTATVYNPLIMLLTDTYDHTDKVQIDTSKGTAGYTGSIEVSAVGASYATVVTLKITDNDLKFVNTGNNANITVSADGKSATVKLNWEIEKADFDLSGLKWEYWYKDGDGTVKTGEYTQAIEYNDNRWIYVRIKADSLPVGLGFSTNYTDVMAGYDTYGDRQKNVGATYTTQFDAANDFVYDTASFNPPDATATTLKLEWEIAPKSVVAKFKLTKHNFSNGNYTGSYYIRELDLAAMGLPASYDNYFKLKYYDSNNNEVTLADIDAAVDLTVEKTYTVKAVINDAVAAAKNYKIVDASGNEPKTTFKTGSSNTPAKFTIDGQDGSQPVKTTYNGNPQFTANITITDENGTVVPATDFDVIYYRGATPVAGNELSGAPTDAGEYCVEIVLKNGAENIYILENEYISVTVEKIKIALPTVDEIIFGNNFVDLAEHLHGSYDEYKDIITLGGDVNGIKFAGTYHATLTITNPNYCWDYGADASAAKGLAKYDLARDWTGDETVAETDWSIKPYVLKTSGWNLKGKDGAVYAIPSELIENLDVALQLWYFTDKAGEHLGEEDVLKAGGTYFVKAELLGADANNFVFEDSNATVSDFVTYKIQPNGAAAFVNNIKDFVTKTWLGLPIWAWLAIGLAALILLIIIIAVACKRRKSKEQRAEEKARKEEEKARREEERRLQQERIEAERELARAKQEAELEKIRAQANMANAGMAATAMQQSTPTPATAPAQADNGAMRKLEAELAEMRLRLASVQQPAQLPAAQQQLPVYQQGVQPAMPSGGSLEEIKMQIALIRAEQQANKELAAMKTELEMARLAAQQGYGRYDGRQPSAQPANVNAELLGDALISAFTKLMGQRTVIPDRNALPDTVEENVSQPVLTQYPSDAVITTTTTVDTTQKPQTRRGERDREDFSDVDGFYDNIDY